MLTRTNPMKPPGNTLDQKKNNKKLKWFCYFYFFRGSLSPYSIALVYPTVNVCKVVKSIDYYVVSRMFLVYFEGLLSLSEVSGLRLYQAFSTYTTQSIHSQNTSQTQNTSHLSVNFSFFLVLAL